MHKTLMIFMPMILCTHLITHAQISENFSDGDYTSNPVWTGNGGDWIVNPSGQLQSNNTVINRSFFITTPNTLAVNAQWDFYINLTFATSGANYTDVYLVSTSGNLEALDNAGYVVRIGNTADEISLYRKDAGNATAVKIIDGVDGAVSSSSNNKIKIKVTRDAANNWILNRDMTGAGTNYFTEGTVSDANITTSSFFGILVKQSTASFIQRHFFDDIEVKTIAPDITPPVVQNAKAISANELDVFFNEPLDNISSQVAANYSVNNGIGVSVKALLDAFDNTVVHLTFNNNLPGLPNNQLTINGVQDIAGNAIINAVAPIVFVTLNNSHLYDIVIDEIMAHPVTQGNLPNNEWIELKNTSITPVNLKGWKLSGHSGTSGAMPDFILPSDSLVIICSSNALGTFTSLGKAIAVTSFPSLGNEGDVLSLISSHEKVIHAVNYSDNWYQNELKKQGGWSLEMMDTKNPCSGVSNWRASTDARGGSPGIENTVDAINPDTNAPKLLRAYTTDSVTIVLVFDEPLDALKAASVNNYSISDGVGLPVAATAIFPVPDKVNLLLNAPLAASKIYSVTVTGITDCTGNAIGNKNIAKVGRSTVADSLDLIINEILFDPPTAGSDYVELYNRSNKIIDLKQTYIANRGTNGAISNITAISAENYLLFPQEFILLSKDVDWVKSSYVTQNADAFATVNLPSYNNDKSSVVVLNAQGNTTDEVTYSDKWHFKLLDKTEGVSLERIDYNGSSQSSANWHSAATSVGYGTPGYKNSQYHIAETVQGELKLAPEIVSPDNDGQDDFATLGYNFPEPGYVANITIFDAAGRRVRYLQHNALCGTKGNFIWDGLGEKSQQLPVGIYIVFAEVFNLKGKTKQFKLPLVLARRY
ncbi:lamin tail domain-containing protein [Ferruginibacter sp.]|uniref:lamin tail domain-containing protein n=1 Tax=Ferruginibacter sp. TaxID=1940288 RepID=UPI00265B3092|nr:lamin tail domain-containing protein [Ferruginibacter sp.]